MLKNKTTGKIIVEEVILYQSIWLKAKGLMFTRKIKDKCLIFDFPEERIISLHMIFVFYPIDVLYLNKEKKVIEIKRNFKPFSFYTPKSKANYVIELPEGETENVKLNDKIEW